MDPRTSLAGASLGAKTAQEPRQISRLENAAVRAANEAQGLFYVEHRLSVLLERLRGATPKPVNATGGGVVGETREPPTLDLLDGSIVRINESRSRVEAALSEFEALV